MEIVNLYILMLDSCKNINVKMNINNQKQNTMINQYS